MSFFAIIGSGLQLALLLFRNWFKYADEKKTERKVLREEGIKAIRSGDSSAITAVFSRLR